MKTIFITGSLGLIGKECAIQFLKNGYHVVGIDNDNRKTFFGENASVLKELEDLSKYNNYNHEFIDICDEIKIKTIIQKFEKNLFAFIHCAAQPSHDWAYKNPIKDFQINSYATLNILKNIKEYVPQSWFIYMSTNKVFGDNPNKIKFKELETRFDHDGEFYNGIPENFNIDFCKHSIFGVNKLYSDLITQEYGLNLGIKSCILRCGCLTGNHHKGAELHGFLSYLSQCVKNEIEYNIFGYKGKQVRDNIHAYDVWSFINEIIHGENIYGEVFNLGGGRENSLSVLEAITKFEKLYNKKAIFKYTDINRVGDHIWYITNLNKAKNKYSNWKITYNIDKIINCFK